VPVPGGSSGSLLSPGRLSDFELQCSSTSVSESESSSVSLPRAKVSMVCLIDLTFFGGGGLVPSGQWLLALPFPGVVALVEPLKVRFFTVSLISEIAVLVSISLSNTVSPGNFEKFSGCGALNPSRGKRGDSGD
jgi:hypothetical protein